MVTFEKQAGKYEPTTNKRTQASLVGKAELDKCKREDDQIEAILDDQCTASQKLLRDPFSLVAQLVKNQKVQKENQGQGRQGDCNRSDYKERDNYRRQGGWDRKQQSRDYREARQYAKTASTSGHHDNVLSFHQ